MIQKFQTFTTRSAGTFLTETEKKQIYDEAVQFAKAQGLRDKWSMRFGYKNLKVVVNLTDKEIRIMTAQEYSMMYPAVN